MNDHPSEATGTDQANREESRGEAASGPSRSGTPARTPSLLVLACVAAPVVCYYVPSWLGWTTQAQSVDVAGALLGACGVLAALVVARAGGSSVPRRPLVAAATFLGWACVAALTSGRGWTGFMGEPENGLGLLVMITVLGIGAAAARAQTDAALVLTLVAPWVVAGEAVLVGYQLAGGFPGAAGTLPNSTYLGQYLVLLLPWVLAGWSGELSRAGVLRLSAAAAGIAALAMTGSRVAFVVAVAWFAWSVTRRREIARGVRVSIVVGLIAVGVLLALVFARAEIIGSTSAAALGLRPELWRASVQATLARPLIGWGPDGLLAGVAASTTIATARAGAALIMQPGGPDPHSILAWIAVSMGTVGLLLFGWLGFEVARACTLGRAERTHAEAGAWALGLLFAIALTAPIALQLFPLIGVVAGTAVGISVPGGGAHRSRRQRISSGVAVVGIALVGCVLAANALTRAPLETPGVATSSRLVASASGASRVWEFDSHLASLAGQHWAYAGGYSRQSHPEEQLAALALASRLDRRNPYHPLDEALALRSAGRPDSAVDAAYAEAYRRYPFHPLARAEHARFLAETGRLEQARAELAIARLGRVDQAPMLQPLIDAAEKALANGPP